MSIWSVDPAQIHTAYCEHCQADTEHVDVIEKTSYQPEGDGGHHDIQVRPLLMCVKCWEKRLPPDQEIMNDRA